MILARVSTLTTAGRVYSPAEPIKVGDIIRFSCNGRGRGGHFTVTATVTKINRKTVDATEKERSYSPGTKWNTYVDEGTYIIRGE